MIDELTAGILIFHISNNSIINLSRNTKILSPTIHQKFSLFYRAKLHSVKQLRDRWVACRSFLLARGLHRTVWTDLCIRIVVGRLAARIDVESACKREDPEADATREKEEKNEALASFSRRTFKSLARS